MFGYKQVVSLRFLKKAIQPCNTNILKIEKKLYFKEKPQFKK